MKISNALGILVSLLASGVALAESGQEIESLLAPVQMKAMDGTSSTVQNSLLKCYFDEACKKKTHEYVGKIENDVEYVRLARIGMRQEILIGLAGTGSYFTMAEPFFIKKSFPLYYELKKIDKDKLPLLIRKNIRATASEIGHKNTSCLTAQDVTKEAQERIAKSAVLARAYMFDFMDGLPSPYEAVIREILHDAESAPPTALGMAAIGNVMCEGWERRQERQVKSKPNDHYILTPDEIGECFQKGGIAEQIADARDQGMLEQQLLQIIRARDDVPDGEKEWYIRVIKRIFSENMSPDDANAEGINACYDKIESAHTTK